MNQLFSSYKLRDLTIRNRIVMPPMAQYLATGDGRPTEWHLVHYGARAVGGVGLIIIEVTSVEPRGRLTPHDLGLWEDAQVEPLARLIRFLQLQGAAVAVQIGHAGRKAWSEDRGWGPALPVSPVAVPFDLGWALPHALDEEELVGIVDSFRLATRRAMQAGADSVEIHGAHGYLLHQFLSPLVNQCSDGYGGSFENRMRLLEEVVHAVRAEVPPAKPLLLRLSCTDWIEGGLTIRDTIQVARTMAAKGVDLVHCSSGGVMPQAVPQVFPGYQVPFAEQVRREAGVPTIAVGLITEPEYAERILVDERADLVALGRELLRNPYWPLQAAKSLGAEIEWPRAYLRAK